MSKVAAHMFEWIMVHMNIDLSKIFDGSLLEHLDANTKNSHPFVSNFKNIWCDNGDYLSKHYCGTGATTTAILKKGKEGFLGLLDHGMKSIERFYIGNFEDNLKQEAIDVLLSQHSEIKNMFGESNINQELLLNEKDFITLERISIFITTWYVGGFQPKGKLDLIQNGLFNMQNNKLPDIIVIGLQEIILLSGAKFVQNNDKQVALWTEIFTENISKLKDKYVFVKQDNVYGLLTLIFVKEEIKPRISKLQSDVVKCGTLGTRGGILIKMDIDNSNLCFINCHLESGQKNLDQRLKNIDDIHEKAFIQKGGDKGTDDFKFLFGDLNFRINLSNDEVRGILQQYQKLINNGDTYGANNILQYLYGNDQLNQIKLNNVNLSKYYENHIQFPPTYKYEIMSDQYDNSDKSAPPAWCDRIMIQSCQENSIIRQLFYNRCEIKYSTHRPVTTYYNIEVKQINQNKKDILLDMIYEKMKEEAQSKLPVITEQN